MSNRFNNSLDAWLRSARGQTLVEIERQKMTEVVPRLFGRTLLQVGEWTPGLIDFDEHWRSGVIGAAGACNVRTNLEALPVGSRSVDAIVLPHSLERVVQPHQLLREVDRVLTARGQLVILGFNPWGVLGLRQRLLRAYPCLPVGLRPTASWRVADWLSVLNFDVLEIQHYGPHLQRFAPVAQSVLRIFASMYMIHARKRTIPVNPLRERWRNAAPSGVNVARIPSARSPAARVRPR